MNEKLCRATIDRKVAGVCGGLAHYFNMDSTLMRLIVLLLMLTTGFGFLFYIIAALIMPESDLY